MLLKRHEQSLLAFWFTKGAFLTVRTRKDVKGVCRGLFKVLAHGIYTEGLKLSC